MPGGSRTLREQMFTSADAVRWLLRKVPMTAPAAVPDGGMPFKTA